ncbi:ribosome biogenesis GTPase Der [bacterium]|nr:ribosome biogenesis GTPase Der [bacterium]
MEKKKFKIAIVGRPNVGKSHLFNRITGGRKSIVEDVPGVTRDRLYAETEFFGKKALFIDTGGIASDNEGLFSKSIRVQAQMAIEESDAIIFVIDGIAGITAHDEDVLALLRKTHKPVIVAINKMDLEKQRGDFSEYYSLGVEHFFPVSSMHGDGIADLLEHLCTIAPDDDKEELKMPPKVAIIGRPNVGKSTILNKLLGKERSLVSDIAGTTLDALDSQINGVCFIDTAGIKRKQKELETVEKYARIRTENAVDRAEICLIVIDASAGVTAQDKKIFTEVVAARKGCIFYINKWDTIEKTQKEHLMRRMEEILPEAKHLPCLVGSALHDKELKGLFEMIERVHENYHRRITTGQLNNFMERILQENPPPVIGTRRLRIYYLTQGSTAPPNFVLFVNYPDLMPNSYKRYLHNRFKEAYDFLGIPLTFYMKAKKSSRKKAKA